MKYAVYWERDDEGMVYTFYATEVDARLQVATLIVESGELEDEDGIPDWQITLLKVIGTVKHTYPTGEFRLHEVK